MRQHARFHSFLLATLGLGVGGLAGWSAVYYGIEALIQSDRERYWHFGYLILHASTFAACACSAVGLMVGCAIGERRRAFASSLGEDAP